MNKEIKKRNDKLIEDFANFKDNNNTSVNYKSDINVFANFLNDDLMNATIIDITNFFKSDKVKGNEDKGIKGKSNATKNRYIASLKNFYNYYKVAGYYKNDNPLSMQKNFKVDREGKTDPLTLEQSKTLIKLIKNKIKNAKSEFQKAIHIRNLALIHCHLNSGCRESELLELTFDRLFLDEGKIILLADDTKGKKKRIVLLPENTIEYIKNYLEVRNILLKNKECKYIFLSKSGGFFDPSSYDNVLKTYGKEIDMPNLRSHQMRASYTTATYYATGKDIIRTQEILSHSDISITRRYIKNIGLENELIKLPTAKL